MTDDVVRTITIKGTTEGVDPATASVNKLSDAMANVATVSETTSKSTLSVQTALDRQQRSLDTTFRSQIQYNQSVGIINKGLNEGLISQSRANDLIDLARDRFDKAAASATPFMAALHGVQTQLVAMAAGAGPVGVFLASFGPWGLAAAAGIGVVTMGFTALLDAATQLAQKAQGLQTFSLITGLTTDQIQKLEEEGSKFGIQTETVGKFLDQFSVKLTTARTAMGPYYDMVRQINPALAQQLLTTQGEAAQLQILAAAYALAGEKGNALLQAASGRGAVQVAPLLGAINSAGSIGDLSGSPQISADEIARMTKELNANTIAWDHIKTNVGAIAFNAGFSDDRRKTREDLEAITAAVRNFSPSQAWNDFVAGFARMIGAGSVSAANFQPPAVPVIPVQSGGNLPAATSAPQNALTPEQIANQYKTYVAALGSAATAQQQYNVKVGEANIQLEKNVIAQGDYNRIIASAGLEKAIVLEGQRIGLLGQAATVTDLLKQREDAIAQARQKGVSITAQEAAGILANTAAAKLSADTTILTTNNVVTLEQLRVTKLAELNALLLQGKLSQDQVTTSAQAYEKVIEQTIQQQEIQKAQFTNLKTLELNSSNVRTQIDTAATDSLNNMTTALTSITMGTQTATLAFKNFGLQVITSLEKMIIQMTITAPIAKALQSTLSGLGGGFNLSSLFGGQPAPAAADFGGSGVGSGGFNFLDAAVKHSGGIVGSEPTSTRYIQQAYFDNAPRFGSGGIVSGEVPIIAHKGEGVFTPGQMAAMGGGSVVIHQGDIHIDASGADPAVVARLQATLEGFRKSQYSDTVKIVQDASNRGMRLHP